MTDEVADTYVKPTDGPRIGALELELVKRMLPPGEETTAVWQPQRLFRLQWLLFFGGGLEQLVVESIRIQNVEQLAQPWELMRPIRLHDERCFELVQPEGQIVVRIKNVGDHNNTLRTKAMGITILEPSELAQYEDDEDDEKLLQALSSAGRG